MTSANIRESEYPIDPLFLERWSPRAFIPEPISEADLLTMIEAARWAASSYNSQPWRFLYARRGTAHWEGFLGLLIEANRAWAKDASALLVLVSNSLMLIPGAEREVPSHSHSLDAGAASAQFALQATRMGWHAHGMVGFDRERAFAELRVPQGYRVEAAYQATSGTHPGAPARTHPPRYCDAPAGAGAGVALISPERRFSRSR